MPIEYQVVPVDISNGVDTKSDAKQVVAGKFLRVENGVFTKPGQIAKRNGYTAAGTTIASVGTISSPKMVHGYNNELLTADQGLLLSYSSNQDAWTSKGMYTSLEVNRTLISDSSQTNGIIDVAISGNYALYGFSDNIPNVYASVVDLSTGDILSKDTVGSGFSGILNVKCCTLGVSQLAIFYQKATNGTWYGKTVSVSGGVVTLGGEVTITTNTATGPFDIISTITGAACIYTQSTTPGITVANISTSLVVTNANTAVTVGDDPVVHISSTSNGNIWAYWTESTTVGTALTALSIYYKVYSSALSVVRARTLLDTVSAPYYVSNIISKSDSATQQTVYYGTLETNFNHYLELTFYMTATSGGVVGSRTKFAYGVIPLSHPFTYGSSIYAVFYYRVSDINPTITATIGAAVQPTYFLLELTNLNTPSGVLGPIPYVAARFASGVASSYVGSTQRIYNTASVANFSSSKFYITVGVTVQEFAAPSTFIQGEIGLYSYSFDFNSSNGYVAKSTKDCVALNGGLLQLYDGFSCSELGFHLFPEITKTTVTAGGGSVADGTYQYLAIYQWIDSQGNLHQSAPSSAVSVVVNSGGGAPSHVDIVVTVPFLTRKPNGTLSIYRTASLGTVFHAIAQSNATLADPVASSTLTFTDTAADATIASYSQPYAYPASSVLENTTPPPSMIMVSHNNRLFFVDSENPNTYWYTKSFENQVGISPSGFLTQQIDPKYGNISALAEMDEKLVIFKSNGIFTQSGDGSDDTGQGSSFSFPQIVPSDVGCSYFKSVILTPDGVIFKSPNGVYILGRSGNTAYLGAEVEQYNSQDITGSTSVPGKSQIRFLTSSGSTLVYDYIFKKWATFTGHTGTSSTTWNSTYVYANNSANKIYKESSTSYLDDATAYSLLLQTSWLRISSIQGFQRVRRLIMLGDYVNGNSALHNLSISAAYDFSTTFQTAVTYAFGTASSSGVFQYRERLSQQKCDTISLLIQETTTGSSLETIDLTNISFEAGIKRGVNKLSGTKSVG